MRIVALILLLIATTVIAENNACKFYDVNSEKNYDLNQAASKTGYYKIEKHIDPWFVADSELSTFVNVCDPVINFDAQGKCEVKDQLSYGVRKNTKTGEVKCTQTSNNVITAKAKGYLLGKPGVVLTYESHKFNRSKVGVELYLDCDADAPDSQVTGLKFISYQTSPGYVLHYEGKSKAACGESKDKKGLNIPAIVGGVVGGLVGFILLTLVVVGVIVVIRRRRSYQPLY
ncbi:Pvrl1 [Acrasis kona]|uniref:Pvrl1 n=1 Tax=Acrasis kona TaxID=1008807 RepID=A0AAW2Z5C5_9EUKA